MSWIDWVIVGAMLAVMVAGILLSRGYMRSVADFLAAGRSAGRYVLCLSQGLAETGAISIIAVFEMNYVAGFAMSWWGFTTNIVVLVLTVSGWIIYRFRETRCLTLAEFFERRYSRAFRIFGGSIAFVAGLINFGIFPAVGARFFIYYCGIPQSFSVVGLEISTFPLLMLFLLGTALFFVLSGGQVAVIVTDFIQGLFVNVVFVAVALYLLARIGWPTIFEALGQAPEQASLVNPFKTSRIDDFNFGYHLIGMFGIIYIAMSWQGAQGYNASASSAHEAKMSGVLTNWRWYPRNLVYVLVPIVGYTVMHHMNFASEASAVQQTLDGIGNEALQNQLRVPLVLAELLPTGLLGAFAAVMLAAFVTTHDTYLHSWASIFVQDVWMPLRREPFTQREHLRALRMTIVAVAVFIFFFSLFFNQTQYISLFFAITGAIFAGGSGAVIIGGLYWKRGTAAAAWSAMITGSGIAVGGILIHQWEPEFFINGQMFWALAMGSASLVYIAVSLLGPRRVFDLDRLLHRGEHAIAGESTVVDAAPARGWRVFGMGREFTRGDKAVYLATYANTVMWGLIFFGGTVYCLTRDVPDSSWHTFWKYFFYLQIAMAVLVVVWFGLGGIRDLKKMFRTLGARERDVTDDGRAG